MWLQVLSQLQADESIHCYQHCSLAIFAQLHATQELSICAEAVLNSQNVRSACCNLETSGH
jgi:hypothetical protein